MSLLQFTNKNYSLQKVLFLISQKKVIAIQYGSYDKKESYNMEVTIRKKTLDSQVNRGFVIFHKTFFQKKIPLTQKLLIIR